jgi:hypothetical protein
MTHEVNQTFKFIKKGVPALLGAALIAASGSASAFDLDLPGVKTKATVGGYVKLDIIYSDVSAGNNNQNNIEFSPNGIPLENTGEEDEAALVFNGRESRVWLKTSTDTDDGPLKTHLEFDFDTNTGNQAVSNSHGGRIRHAYGSYQNWLFGRTWSAFMYLPGLPETNDFGGPTGDIFVRQAQLRFTSPMEGGSFVVSIENPETVAITGNPVGNWVGDDGTVPDVVVRYNAPWWSVAALVRQLNVDEGAVDESTSAVAAQFAGNLPIGSNDKLQWILSGGDGIGRYGSLLGHFDGYVTSNGDLEALQTIQGFVAFQHKWSQTTRSNIALGFTSADDPTELQGSGFTEESSSLHVNWMWNPVPALRHGIEFIHGERETYGGAEGELNRLQWSSRVVF